MVLDNNPISSCHHPNNAGGGASVPAPGGFGHDLRRETAMGDVLCLHLL